MGFGKKCSDHLSIYWVEKLIKLMADSLQRVHAIDGIKIKKYIQIVSAENKNGRELSCCGNNLLYKIFEIFMLESRDDLIWMKKSIMKYKVTEVKGLKWECKVVKLFKGWMIDKSALNVRITTFGANHNVQWSTASAVF